MTWVPLHLHSHYSLLDGYSKPDDIAAYCKEQGYNSCALTDHGTISGAVTFYKACKAQDIKPILGCEFYVSQKPVAEKDKENRHLDHIVLLAKNKDGWDQLVNAVSYSNSEEAFYYKPRLDKSMMAQLLGGDNIICITGHPGTELAGCLFTDPKEAYNAKTYKEAKALLHPQWKQRAYQLIRDYDNMFRGNLYLEIQLIDQDRMPSAKVIGECLRSFDHQKVATADSHYVRRSDAEYQRILLCAGLRTNMKKINESLERGESVPLAGFFLSDSFHIPTEEEMLAIHTEEEIANAAKIADMCEEYEILGKPMLPTYNTPEGYDEDSWLRELCRKGWAQLLQSTGKVDDPKVSDIYRDRIVAELDVISGADLAGYFLIVRGIIEFVESQGWMAGPGRGSAAGCLVSYLVGITQVDPIEYDLIFERFYNAGRNTDDHVALPDIDIDVPAEHRDEVIDYIKRTYGEERVSQMLTFGRLAGRAALKEVMRTEGGYSFTEMNELSKLIPHEADVSDQLEAMGEKSILKFALYNEPKLSKYCKIDDLGLLSGSLAHVFEQAIAIEGTYKTQGKHAAGVIISSKNLDEVCPMVRDKEGKRVAGLEMNDLESMGHVKFDVLGIDLLSKIMEVKETF